MNVRAITLLIGLGLTATAGAEDTRSNKAASSKPASRAQLSKIRSVVHELERDASKLGQLMSQYRSLLEQRPQRRGGGREAKQAHEKQMARWNGAVDRLLRRIDKARAAVVGTKKRLDSLMTAKLPTALGKEVANAHNRAEAERAAAERVLAQRKPAPARPKKRVKKKPETEEELPLGDLDEL